MASFSCSPERMALARTLTSAEVSMRSGGGSLQRVSLCMSRSAQSRSVAHALNCQFFTMPQGNPGDAGEGRAWSVRRRGKDTSRGAPRLFKFERWELKCVRKNPPICKMSPAEPALSLSTGDGWTSDLSKLDLKSASVQQP